MVFVSVVRSMPQVVAAEPALVNIHGGAGNAARGPRPKVLE